MIVAVDESAARVDCSSVDPRGHDWVALVPLTDNTRGLNLNASPKYIPASRLRLATVFKSN